MSKVEVKVKAGDEWDVWNGSLYQKRKDDERHVCNASQMAFSSWNKIVSSGGQWIPAESARAWIESLGGEWAEVAEEKAAKVVAHVSEIGAVYLSIEGSEEFKASEKANFRRIAIAGVT